MVVLNGSGLPMLNEDQQSCVDLLRDALNEAEAGQISSVAIVVCMKGGYATVMAGRDAGDINLGCDAIKRRILDALESGNRRQHQNVGQRLRVS